MDIGIWYIVAVIVIVLLSMTLHEAMHGFVSNWLGDDTAKREGRLTLNPVAHIDPFLTLMLPALLALTSVVTGAQLPIFGGAKPVPFNPNRVKYGELGAALVGLAGPATNFFIAFILFGILVLTQIEGILSEVIGLAVMINLGFFVFNMIPIPPLDGSRLLYVIAPDGIRRLMETIEQRGVLLVFAVVLLFSGAIGNVIRLGVDLCLDLFRFVFQFVL